MDPEVSVIVPVYNVAQYLPKCLESLINQTFKKIEIICFNDASTDNSLEILRNYERKDNRIKIINSEINVKQGGGRNRAIKASEAPYITFVDSDDWVSPDFIEKLYTALITTHADIITADYYESRNGELQEISLLGKKITCDTDELKRLILSKGCRLVTTIFKRELFFQNNLFFPEGLFYEDNAIGYALFLSANKIMKIDDIVYYYRVDNTSTTRAKNNYNFFDRLETSVMMLDNCKRLGFYESYKTEINRKFYELYYSNTIFGCINLFSSIPNKQIHYILNSIDSYLDSDNQKRYLNELPFINRCTLRFIKFSPWFGSRMLKLVRNIWH